MFVCGCAADLSAEHKAVQVAITPPAAVPQLPATDQARCAGGVRWTYIDELLSPQGRPHNIHVNAGWLHSAGKHGSRLWRLQLEWPDLCVEGCDCHALLAVQRLHMEVAQHLSAGARQDAARVILEARAWCQHWLLPNHACAGAGFGTELTRLSSPPAAWPLPEVDRGSCQAVQHPTCSQAGQRSGDQALHPGLYARCWRVREVTGNAGQQRTRGAARDLGHHPELVVQNEPVPAYELHRLRSALTIVLGCRCTRHDAAHPEPPARPALGCSPRRKTITPSLTIPGSRGARVLTRGWSHYTCTPRTTAPPCLARRAPAAQPMSDCACAVQQRVADSYPCKARGAVDFEPLGGAPAAVRMQRLLL